ncbi:UNVERIFIED_CONTAM: hypothetical protein HDU68_010246 [Siphonaria sp. JEL0065]|nr:hypothetical protein HDU68_010246 [Siphonaria sp. JEL0065]
MLLGPLPTPTRQIAKAAYLSGSWKADSKFAEPTIFHCAQEPQATTDDFLRQRIEKLNTASGSRLCYIIGFLTIVTIVAVAVLDVQSIIPLGIEYMVLIQSVILIIGSVASIMLHPLNRIERMVKKFNRMDQGDLEWILTVGPRTIPLYYTAAVSDIELGNTGNEKSFSGRIGSVVVYKL